MDEAASAVCRKAWDTRPSTVATNRAPFHPMTMVWALPSGLRMVTFEPGSKLASLHSLAQ